VAAVDQHAPDPAAPDGPDEAGPPPRPSRWAAVRFPIGLFLAVALVLYVVSWISITWLERQPHYPVGPEPFWGSSFLEGWFRFDGGWYRLIARDGYFYAGPDQQSAVAYFPAYPLAMRAVHLVVRDYPLSGIIVTFLSGMGVAVLFYRWCVSRLGVATARLALLVLLVYPYAWYLFGAVYADALFLVAVLGAFTLVEKGHPVLAGIVGMVATAARPVGIALLVGLIALVLEQRGAIRIPAVDRIRANGWRHWRDPLPVAVATGNAGGPAAPDTGRRVLGVVVDLRRLRPVDTGVVIALAGLGAWCAYLWTRWGDPFLFAAVQKAPGWDQGSGPRTWFKITFLQRLRHLPYWLSDSLHGTTVHNPRPWTESAETLGLLLQGLLVLAAIVLVPLVLRRLGWAYALYVLGVILIPLFGSKDFQGAGRYLLAAFPCFAVVGAALAHRPRLRAGWLVVSGGLLLLLVSAYARGYYVA